MLAATLHRCQVRPSDLNDSGRDKQRLPVGSNPLTFRGLTRETPRSHENSTGCAVISASHIITKTKETFRVEEPIKYAETV